MNNKKDNFQFICYIISLLFMGLTYLLIDNLYFALFNGVCFFYVIYKNVVLVYKQVHFRINNFERFKCFTNRIIMQLSVTPSVSEAFRQISNISNEEYNDVLQDDSLLVGEKLDNLEYYFSMPLYQVLKQILLIYEEQGGQILEMSQELLNKCDLEYSNMLEIYSINKQKWSECLIMWVFAILGFIYLRSALISYYLILIRSLIFVAFIEGFILMFIYSLSIVSNRYLKEQIDL